MPNSMHALLNSAAILSSTYQHPERVLLVHVKDNEQERSDEVHRLAVPHRRVVPDQSTPAVHRKHRAVPREVVS